MSKDPYLLFGRLCVKANHFAATELREAISQQFKEQKKGSEKLFGDICIELGLLTQSQRDEILQQQCSEEVIAEATVFGYLAIVNGFVKKDKVTEALKKQKELKENNEKKKIGEILLEMRALAPIQVQAILKTQHRLRNGIRSTTYLSQELAKKSEESQLKISAKKAKQGVADTGSKISLRDGSDLDLTALAKKSKSKNKPSIDEIQEKLRKLEQDFGGSFEIMVEDGDNIEPEGMDFDFDDSMIAGSDFTPSAMADTNLLNEFIEEEQIKKTSEIFNISLTQQLGSLEYDSGADVEDYKKIMSEIDDAEYEDSISVYDTDYLASQLVFEAVPKNSEFDNETNTNVTIKDYETTLHGENVKFKKEKTSKSTRKISKAPKISKQTDVALDKIELKPVEEIEYKGEEKKVLDDKKSRIYNRPGENKFRGRVHSRIMKVNIKKEYPVKKILLIITIILAIIMVYFVSSAMFK